MILERLIERGRERLRLSRPTGTAREHAAAAVGWLYRAQDANGDGGVSHSYLLGKGWMRSYPETTGYIIPTLLNWSATTGDDEARQRALNMSQWELRIRLDSGAIPNLTDGKPTVFETGQVIFGWMAAYGSTGDAIYLDAATKAADWLLEERDADGVWRHESDSGGPGRVYNACMAWALAELAIVSGNQRYADSIRPFLQWSLSLEKGNGWFDRNCLGDDAAPLLHTIAYAARGQFECGWRLDWPELVSAATRTAWGLLPHVREDGWMPGRFGRHWRAATPWACLTGMAQTSVLWQRLHARDAQGVEGDTTQFLNASHRVNEFLRRSQDRTSQNGGLRGGIRGSYPIHGAYGQYRVLNWATKFFVDAMLEEIPEKRLPYPF